MIPGYVTGQVRDRPQIGDYAYRARRYPMAEQALQRAQARHGEPVPTCLCGGRLRLPAGARKDFARYRCDRCGNGPS